MKSIFMGNEVVVGIDLGTTNSEIAAFLHGEVKVLGPRGERILPSCVGLSPEGELLVGHAARNQQLLYPERTVRSIKRKMGESVTVLLGDRSFTPTEISALILRELRTWANAALERDVEKAVITVPAYFSDVQRQAVREAGQIAGLEVLRILNEPTAASLAYGFGEKRQTALVYDLGGGTFDVSVVTVEGDVTEVLASHGNNQLGGDDFDALLVEHLASAFQSQYGVDVRHGHPLALARLSRAAEDAKMQLSFEPYHTVREEALLTEDGKALHFSLELSREEYESLIAALIDSTLDSVARALEDSGKSPRELDAVLLVGGSTRTPLVSRRLRERTGLDPRQDVHPDLCVALGAGVLASRMAGHDVGKVLVDVSPYSFGTSFLGKRGNFPYPYCYKKIIERNTPLPLTRTESFYTAVPFQETVQIDVYQGEDDDALKNLLVGDFQIDGLTPREDANEVLCRMSLDIDGILHVTGIEKKTGKQKGITVTNALTPKTDEEIATARACSQELFATRVRGEDESDDEEVSERDERAIVSDESLEPEQEFHPALELVERSRTLMGRMHPDDLEEAVNLNERVHAALQNGDDVQIEEALEKLRELLFFVESR
jgi:molecular chaperone DnaK